MSKHMEWGAAPISPHPGEAVSVDMDGNYVLMQDHPEGPVQPPKDHAAPTGPAGTTDTTGENA